MPSSRSPGCPHPARFLLLAAAILAAPAQAYWIRDCRTVPATWSASTSMVADLNPGAADAVHDFVGITPQDEQMLAFGDALYLQGDDGQHGAELWRVAGGAPTLVADVLPGSAGSNPHAFAAFKGRLYFAARTADGHDALYRTDGSSVALAADPGTAPGKPVIEALTVMGDVLYFVRSTEAAQQLWRFDGTTAQPVTVGGAPINDVPVDSLVDRALVPFKGRLYFVRSNGPDYRLWSYDGSSLTFVKALTFPGNTVRYSFGMGVYGDALYFGSVVPGQAPFQADELWRYTGSGAPTKVATLKANATSTSQPSSFAVYHDTLYFQGGAGLYRYDGATLQLLDSGPGALPWHPGQMSLYPAADRLFFRAFYDSYKDTEPYLFDGASASLVRDIMPAGTEPYEGSFPSRATVLGDALYFFAADATHGRELWRLAPAGRAPQLKCDIVVAPIWTDWRLWIERERDVIVATWLLAPGERPRLISRERAAARPDRELRYTVLVADTRRSPVPAGARLVTRVFDARTGAVIDSGEASVGAEATPIAAGLRARRTDFSERTLQQVQAEAMRGF